MSNFVELSQAQKTLEGTLIPIDKLTYSKILYVKRMFDKNITQVPKNDDDIAFVWSANSQVYIDTDMYRTAIIKKQQSKQSNVHSLA